MKLAFSTVACPEWTLGRVIELAGSAGFSGLEFRTFGHADHRLSCDPCHTGAAKLTDMLEDAGVEPVSVATSIKYDQVVWPPVVGRVIGDFDRPVRETRAMVQVASAIGAQYLRVFGNELQRNEPMNTGIRRILERLDGAVRTTRHTGTRLLLESGGSFAKGEHLARLLGEATGWTSAGAPVTGAYNVAAAHAAGESPAAGLEAMRGRLSVIKLMDATSSGVPCELGRGMVGVEEAVKHAAAFGFDGWFVVEYPRVWSRELADPEGVLRSAAEMCYRWWGEATRSKHRTPAA